jgi:hypothetical protein
MKCGPDPKCRPKNRLSRFAILIHFGSLAIEKENLSIFCNNVTEFRRFRWLTEASNVGPAKAVQLARE